MTKIIATHDLPVAYELCERVLILDEGRIAADGPVGAVLFDAALLAEHSLELPYGFAPRGSLGRERRRGI